MIIQFLEYLLNYLKCLLEYKNIKSFLKHVDNGKCKICDKKKNLTSS